MHKIRRYFISGLLVTLPLFITFYVLYAIFIFIDGMWGKFINLYLKKHLGFYIPGLGFVLGIVTIIAVGFIAANFLGKKLFQFFEGWFLRFPFIKQVYDPAKQIIHAIMSKEKAAFKKVVLVEYPSKGIWSVGFLMNDSFAEANEKIGQEMTHVFIGTSPTPFSGFLILVPKRDVKVLDIPIEEGLKLVMSGGILNP